MLCSVGSATGQRYTSKVIPNVVTIATVFPSCAQLGGLQQLKWPNRYVFSTLKICPEKDSPSLSNRQMQTFRSSRALQKTDGALAASYSDWSQSGRSLSPLSLSPES
ncbi:hypothetical protein SUGI_0937450 [Cryptomeria japonica]|nr:hypothetical protein SUGI_0937450 [Cryptomeria japonica]